MRLADRDMQSRVEIALQRNHDDGNLRFWVDDQERHEHAVVEAAARVEGGALDPRMRHGDHAGGRRLGRRRRHRHLGPLQLGPDGTSLYAVAFAPASVTCKVCPQTPHR